MRSALANRSSTFLRNISFRQKVRLWPADASPEMLCAKPIADRGRQQWRDWVSPGMTRYLAGFTHAGLHR